jgi:hypothetical protein
MLAPTVAALPLARHQAVTIKPRMRTRSRPAFRCTGVLRAGRAGRARERVSSPSSTHTT